MEQHKVTGRLLNVRELPKNDNRLPTSDDRKTSLFQQATELGIVQVKRRV